MIQDLLQFLNVEKVCCEQSSDRIGRFLCLLQLYKHSVGAYSLRRDIDSLFGEVC